MLKGIEKEFHVTKLQVEAIERTISFKFKKFEHLINYVALFYDHNHQIPCYYEGRRVTVQSELLEENAEKFRETLYQDLYHRFFIEFESVNEIDEMMRKYFEENELLTRISSKINLKEVGFSTNSLDRALYIICAVRCDVMEAKGDAAEYREWLMEHFVRGQIEGLDDCLLESLASLNINKSAPAEKSQVIEKLTIENSSPVVPIIPVSVSFHERLFSLFQNIRMPVPNLTPIILPSNNSTLQSPNFIQFYQQFIPHIFEEIRNTILNQLELIEKKQIRYFTGIYIKSLSSSASSSKKSQRFSDFFDDDEAEEEADQLLNNSNQRQISFYFQVFSSDMPKLDHGFNFEAIMIQLPSSNKIYYAIAQEKSNDGKFTKLLITMNMEDFHEIIRPHIPSSNSNPKQLLSNQKFNLFWLCGLIPSERIYKICQEMPSPSILSQLLSFNFPLVNSISSSELVAKKASLLNSTQQEIIDNLLTAFRNESNGFYFIQGPPGTGKTTTTIELLANIIQQFPTKRILVTAPTNQAIINILQRIKTHSSLRNISISFFGAGKGKTKSSSSKNSQEEGFLSLFSMKEFLIEKIQEIEQMKNLLQSNQLVSASVQTSEIVINLEKKSEKENVVSSSNDEARKITSTISKRIPTRRNIHQEEEQAQEYDPISQFIQEFQKKFSVIYQQLEMKCKIDNLSFLKDIRFDCKRKINELFTTLHDKQSNIIISKEKDCIDLLDSIISLLQSHAIDLENFYLMKSQIVFSTLISSGRQKLQNCFAMKEDNKEKNGLIDFVIVDEAAQALLPELCIPLSFHPKYFIQIGDPNQLPATVVANSSRSCQYDSSLMHWVHRHYHPAQLTRNESKDSNKQKDSSNSKKQTESIRFEEIKSSSSSSPMLMLTTQYRMHESICSFPSRQYYQGQLCTPPEILSRPCILQDPIHQLPVAIQQPNLLFDVSSGKEMKNSFMKSYFNEKEVDGIMKIVEYLIFTKNFHPKDLGIITFYNAQIELLKKKWIELLQSHSNSFKQQQQQLSSNDLTISTVDGFQGDERNIILISMVRTVGNGSIGFLNDFRRFNVALTRARFARWIFCSIKALSNCQGGRDIRSFLQEMMKKGERNNQQILHEEEWNGLLNNSSISSPLSIHTRDVKEAAVIADLVAKNDQVSPPERIETMQKEEADRYSCMRGKTGRGTSGRGSDQGRGRGRRAGGERENEQKNNAANMTIPQQVEKKSQRIQRKNRRPQGRNKDYHDKVDADGLAEIVETLSLNP
jgi:superfamily I DNA and/or RNA helicase